MIRYISDIVNMLFLRKLKKNLLPSLLNILKTLTYNSAWNQNFKRRKVYTKEGETLLLILLLID